MPVRIWAFAIALMTSCQGSKVSTRAVTTKIDSATPTDTSTSVSKQYTDTTTSTNAVAVPVETPNFIPASGTYTSAHSVTISSTTSGATIYYSTDGSSPTIASILYSGAITVSTSQTIKAIAVKAGATDSTVATANYVIDSTPPTLTYTSISPLSPHWSRTPTVTMSLSEAATVTLYSDSGCTMAVSSPTNLASGSGGTITTNNLTVIANTTLYAEAIDAAGNHSTCTSMTTYANIIRLQDPNPSLYNGFAGEIIELSNGNIVIAAPYADIGGITNSGAVYLFNGTTGELISTLHGSSAGDAVGDGGIVALSNGKYVVISSIWNCSVAAGCADASVQVGAVTLCSGSTGINGEIDVTNSLVGSSANDYVGNRGVTALSNGNYVIASSSWDCTVAAGCAGNVVDVGAATWASGTTGLTGAVNSANSLIGSSFTDNVAEYGAVALSNGNYVVNSYKWSGNKGAVTWGSGATGITGVVSAANSLVGSTINDQVGYPHITTLGNGNYLVSSYWWDCKVAVGCAGTVADVGAVTWGAGASGISGAVLVANSLVGATANDGVGDVGSIVELTNSNYVVSSRYWNCTVAAGCSSSFTDAGAVTWGSGSAGISGFITSTISLVGRSANELFNIRVERLTNGNYVLRNGDWDCTVAAGCSGAITDVGAVTWGSGTAGVAGFVDTTNSLVGSTAGDQIGQYVVATLSNGN